MLTSNFDYYLPQEAIAQKPLEPRDHSRLLVLDKENENNKNNKNIEHSYFYNLPNYLKEGDTLVFNDTKVMPARLLGRRDGTGGKVEVFLLNRIDGDDWEVLVKPGKKARPGVRVVFEGKNGYNNEKVKLECEILSVTDTGGRVVRFFYDGVFETIIDIVGETPLPPYIKEKLADKNRYQTVYASEQGSAAAPTAGLHFTGRLIDELKDRKVNMAFVTLHVGLGTFRPVSAANITEHIMHQEYYSIPEETVKIIENTKKKGGRIIAVGTTAVRALETAGRQAARACLETSNLTNDERFLSQTRQNFAGLAGLCQEILTQDGSKIAVSGRVDSFQTCPPSGWTDIFIYPGYKFRVIDGMITNFHLPKSTLLMLVCALAGREKVLGAYEEAVKQGYRFFSFGDAMLIL